MARIARGRRAAAEARSRLLGLVVALAPGLGACQQVPEDQRVDLGGDDDGFEEVRDAPRLDPSNCDPLSRSCPPGQKCAALRQGQRLDRFTCVNDDGALAPGQACIADPRGGQDGCLAGSGCVTGDFELSDGLCVPLCRDDGDCGPGRCIEDPGTALRHCAPACDPLVRSCSAPRQACFLVEREFVCRYPGPGDIAGPMEACELVDALVGCLPGLMCVQSGALVGCAAPRCCTPLCNLEGGGAGCDGPTTCNEFGLQPPRVGGCTVPQ